MIVTLCNAKGGTGKSTLSILLASALAEAGHSAAVLDTDPQQQTARRWLVSTASDVKLAEDGKSYDALFMDTAPRLDSQRVTSSVRRSDLVIVVSSPSPADLFTSRDTVQMLEREGVKNRARLLFNQVQTGTVLSRELDEMAERIGLRPLKNVLHRRKAYQHAVLMGWKRCCPRRARKCSRRRWKSPHQPRKGSNRT